LVIATELQQIRAKVAPVRRSVKQIPQLLLPLHGRTALGLSLLKMRGPLRGKVPSIH
jgi:hypothetical protein